MPAFDPPRIVIHKLTTTALKLFNGDRLRWLDEAAEAGPVSALQLGRSLVYVITDADTARAMLIGNADRWSRPPSSRFPLRLAVGDNLFTASEKVWKLVQPHLAPSFRRSAMTERLDAIDQLIATEISALPYDTVLDLDLAMARITLVVAAWVLLGEHLERARAEELAQHQRKVVAWVAERMSSPLSAVPFARGRGGRAICPHSAALTAYAAEVVARRTATRGSSGDALDALIESRPGGKRLSDRALTSHVLGLLLAGNETTAASLGWTLVHASTHPDEWTKVRNNPKHSDHFIAETHRLTPAVWALAHAPSRVTANARERTFEAPDGEVTLRRGIDAITTYVRGMNRSSRYWPNPETFDPNRHDRATAEQRQSTLTYGLGPRGCIGRHLAVAELDSAVPRLAAHADVGINEPVTEDPAFALRVKGGLTGVLHRPTRDDVG